MSVPLFAGLDATVHEHEPMSAHTSFGVGGPVRYLVEPRDWDAFQAALLRGRDAGYRVRILGRGSNLLVTDEPHDWVVLSTCRLGGLRRSGTCIEADAGLYLPRLVSTAESWGLGGLEPLAGIPGTVGGAVAMNAGGRYGRVANCLVGAVVAGSHLHFAHGRYVPNEDVTPAVPHWVDAAELGLDYRYSIVPSTGLLLLSATFQLDKAPPRELVARRDSILAEKHATQPMDARSAGCIFKNPPRGSHLHFAHGGHVRSEDVTPSAGWLIDQAGLKGSRVGGAVVSPKHANFIVNDGGATARNVLDLIEVVTQRVLERFGVRLEPEVEVWSNNEEERR
ncbi:MAG: UDP-N-acetylmuramate dehydrogenase [Planctomycetes bacterium]|nr:UDP-N-acetylmuramate dehydrogenase [Planctomycetota bacterium]